MNLGLPMDKPSLRRPQAASRWQRLGQRLRRRDRRPVLVLAPIGLDPQRDAMLGRAFESLGLQLGLRFELDDPDAEVVLMDVDYAGRTSTHLVRALTGGGRPCCSNGQTTPAPRAWRRCAWTCCATWPRCRPCGAA